MSDALFIALQRLTPQHALSRAAGLLASSTTPMIKNSFIQWFAKKYDVDMSEALEPNLESYACFNDFFTRALKPGARPICGDDLMACPADGAISQLGDIKDGRIFQAKGQDYSLLELVGGHKDDATPFMDGNFATIYLSPKDYHRVHMPWAGKLTKMTHIPGDLFSVNTATAEGVPRLFARNERVVCHFETDNGPVAVVLVGAMIVASVYVPWQGLVAPVKKQVRHWDYRLPTDVNLDKGAEMGRFLLGSTAIILTEKDRFEWKQHLKAGSKVRMGEAIGSSR